MEPDIQPTWDVTYHDNDGHTQTITVSAEGWQAAISAASPQVKGPATWYFMRAEPAKKTALTAGEYNLLQWFVDGGGMAQYGECYGGPLDTLIKNGFVTVAGSEYGTVPDFLAKGSDLMHRPVAITDEGRAALKLK